MKVQGKLRGTKCWGAEYNRINSGWLNGKYLIPPRASFRFAIHYAVHIALANKLKASERAP
jgi:hypothetical protein